MADPAFHPQRTTDKEVIDMATRKKFRIPGITFSWKRLLGITQLKQKIARATGIPTTKEGRQRKRERMLYRLLFGKRK